MGSGIEKDSSGSTTISIDAPVYDQGAARSGPDAIINAVSSIYGPGGIPRVLPGMVVLYPLRRSLTWKREPLRMDTSLRVAPA